MIRFLFLMLGFLLFILGFLLLIGVLKFLNLLTVLQIATLVGTAFSLIGVAPLLVRPWWRTRRWYKDLYDFVEEMVPYSPREVTVLDESRNENYQPLIEAYRVKMEIIPDEVNRTFRERPPDTPVSESFVECLCNEGYSLRDRLRKNEQDEPVNYIEVKHSVEIIDAVSLVIRYQIEEEVRWFKPRKAEKLLDDDTGFSSKGHARDTYNCYLQKDRHEGVRSALLEAYYETNRSPEIPRSE